MLLKFLIKLEGPAQIEGAEKRYHINHQPILLFERMPL